MHRFYIPKRKILCYRIFNFALEVKLNRLRLETNYELMIIMIPYYHEQRTSASTSVGVSRLLVCANAGVLQVDDQIILASASKKRIRLFTAGLGWNKIRNFADFLFFSHFPRRSTIFYTVRPTFRRITNFALILPAFNARKFSHTRKFWDLVKGKK